MLTGYQGCRVLHRLPAPTQEPKQGSAMNFLGDKASVLPFVWPVGAEGARPGAVRGRRQQGGSGAVLLQSDLSIWKAALLGSGRPA